MSTLLQPLMVKNTRSGLDSLTDSTKHLEQFLDWMVAPPPPLYPYGLYLQSPDIYISPAFYDQLYPHIKGVMLYITTAHGIRWARITVLRPKDRDKALEAIEFILSTIPILIERSKNIHCQHYGDELLDAIR